MLSLQLRLLAVALRVYARFPLPGRVTEWVDRPRLAGVRALRYLPLAGVAVAVPAAIVYAFAAQWLPHAVAVLAAMLASLLLGGAVHERGLTAWFDLVESAPARPGAVPPANAARVGSLAAISVAVVMLARLEMLSSIDPSWIAFVIVCAAAWSRGCAVLVAASLAPAKPPAGGVALALLLGAAPVVAAVFWTQDAVVWATAAALALLAAAVLRRQTRRRIAAAPWAAEEAASRDGCAPDAEAAPRRGTHAVLGAVQVIAELAFLAGVLATLAVAEDAGEPDYS